MQEMQVRFLGEKDPLEKEMASHSGILTKKSPCTEEPAGLQSMGLQTVGHDRGIKQQQQCSTGEEQGLQTMAWASTLVFSFTDCASGGKLLDLSVPPFSLLQHEDYNNSIFQAEHLQALNGFITLMCLGPCQAYTMHCKCVFIRWLC